MRIQRTRVSRRLAGLVATALAGAVLSGCSVAGTEFHPGVAARVGDRTVTTDEVDRLTTAGCEAFSDQLKANNTVVPLRNLRSTIAQDLALVAAARQLAEGYDITPSEQYTSELATTRSSVGDLPADQLEAVQVLNNSSKLISDLLGQVGARIATDAGAADPPAAASDEAVQKGADALGTWLEEHDVVLDPRYGVELTTKGIKAADTSVSYAVSAAATQGRAEQPDTADVMALPASQRCGSSSGGASLGGS